MNFEIFVRTQLHKHTQANPNYRRLKIDTLIQLTARGGNLNYNSNSNQYIIERQNLYLRAELFLAHS